jgi:hypothetical protein
VIFKVRQPGRDHRLGADRTNRRGIARAGHTFGEVSGRATFRFYVVVPGQREWPYEKARSKGRRVVVEG